MEKIVFIKLPDIDTNSIGILYTKLSSKTHNFCFAVKADEPEYVVAATNSADVISELSTRENYYFPSYEINKEDIKKGRYEVMGNKGFWPSDQASKL